MGRKRSRQASRQGEVDDQDGVLLDDAYQQEQPDQRDDGQLHPEDEQGEHSAHAGGGQRRQHGEGMHQAFVQDAQQDVDDDDGRQDQHRLLLL